MLILFDIDGTILVTQKAGVHAMIDAARELFGPQFTFEGIDFSGRLDPLIWKAAAELNGIADHAAHHERFRATYGRHLQHRLTKSPTTTLLPGVKDLVNALASQQLAEARPGSGSNVTLGLLTGNYPETGTLKIRLAGLDPSVFKVNAWGCEAATRRDLPRLAMQRYRESIRANLEASDVVIIGDTPHDIDCARANDCRSIAVATGWFKADDLRSYGPDLVVENLADTQAMLEWITTSRRAVAQ